MPKTKYRDYVPVNARRFGEYLLAQAGIQPEIQPPRPRSNTLKATAWEEYSRMLETSPETCKGDGLIGCLGWDCKWHDYLSFSQLTASGVPFRKTWELPKVTLCDTCKLLFFAGALKYECKDRWVKQAANNSRTGIPRVRGNYDNHLAKLMERLQPWILEANQTMAILQQDVVTWEFHYQGPFPPWPGPQPQEDYSLTYLDYSQASKEYFILYFYPNTIR